MYCLSPAGLIACKDGSLCDAFPGSWTPLSTFYKLLEIERARFGTAPRLAAWSGVAPGKNESARKQRSGKTRQGSHPCGLQDTLSTLRPSCSPRIQPRLRHGRKTRYGWVATPYPTGTCTLQETPSLSWRENAQHQPILEALDLLRQYAGRKQRFYGAEDEVPLDGVIPRAERSRVVEQTPQGQTRVHRVKYEIAVLQGLRERLRCKEIWVPGAQRYRNPDDDLPPDFPTQRPTYYQALDKPLAVDTFLTDLQHQMTQALQRLDTSMPTNPGVKILQRPRGWIRVSPSERQPDPPTLAHLKAEVLRRWPMTSLLDVLKETDLRVDFTHYFTGTGTRTALDRASLQRRLLLCLFGLGTNTGLKRVCATMPEDAYHELLYVRRHYLHADALRNAIAHVANAIFRIRAAHIWGEGATACASDAKHFGAWDQNLLTEWHLRYGGRGVMVYWHVEKRAVCIYSQLKTVSSSEVATMLEGLLRHGTEMPLEKNYVDSHGQSEVAFAFCHLLNFQLLPRLKGIHRQKLYRPTTGQPEAYPHLQAILTRPIRWDLIRQHYETMIQYATALRLGTADAETILKRFTRSPFPHPTYHAVIELGKVIKTIFLCQYLQEEALRREINDGLQVSDGGGDATVRRGGLSQRRAFAAPTARGSTRLSESP